MGIAARHRWDGKPAGPLRSTGGSDTTPSVAAAPFTHEDLITARRRLAGDLVATPLIGGLELGGGDVRFKPERMQPTGSAFYRGALHWCSRQLGTRRGVVLNGAGLPVAALAAVLHSARSHRIPLEIQTTAEAAEALDPRALDTRDRDHGRWQVSRDPRTAVDARLADGWTAFPEWTDPAVALGLATLGAELAEQVPADCGAVVVTDPLLVPGIRWGLALVRNAGAGREGPGSQADQMPDVVAPAVDPVSAAAAASTRAPEGADDLLAEVRRQCGVDLSGPAATAAFAWAVARDDGCCVVA